MRTTPRTELERMRRERGWSQRYVATLMGVTQKAVSRVECGDLAPGSYFRKRAAEVFAVPATELFEVA